MSVLKYSLCFMLPCIAFASLYGQQTQQISHYMLNPQMFNPACAGFSNAVVISGIHRQQWYGFEGAPQTTIISADAPLRSIRSGIGLNIANDRIGEFNNTAIQLTYNYQLPFAEGTLSFGLQGNMNSYGLQGDFTPPTGETDHALENKKAELSKFLFDFSTGVFYQVPDQYEIGLSVERINGPKSTELNFRESRILNLSAGYHFTLERFPSIDFVPSTLIRSDFSAMQIDVSLLGVYESSYWGGISYRLGDAFVFMGGMFITPLNMQVGLAYDLTTSRLIRSSKIGGTFEVFARYCFNLSVDRLPRSYKNSRYL